MLAENINETALTLCLSFTYSTNIVKLMKKRTKDRKAMKVVIIEASKEKTIELYLEPIELQWL